MDRTQTKRSIILIYTYIIPSLWYIFKIDLTKYIHFDANCCKYIQ